jgi:hypothetical protein
MNTLEMERQSVCEYANDGRRITQPGKFEGEPVFAPYFWDLGLQGFSDSDDGKVFTFRLAFNGTDKDIPFKVQLREWLGCSRTLKMYEDDQGFVHCF